MVLIGPTWLMPTPKISRGSTPASRTNSSIFGATQSRYSSGGGAISNCRSNLSGCSNS